MKSKSKPKESNLHTLPWYLGWFALGLVGLCGLATYYSFYNLPETLNDISSEEYSFNGARAWESLMKLDALGPKTTGSVANEVLAVAVLQREFDVVNATKHRQQHVLFDRQQVSGAYGIRFFGSSMVSVYRNVQNMVAKLVGESDEHALMLNCHFDSVASSPGASDDCGSCAVMLEVLRVLSREERRPRWSIVFLFNGAEETPLQASHGFITKHPWATNVRAFLNLESAGSGAKEILFQSGPQHPWLIESYAKAVQHPFAHAIGEEIFQYGLIPSDTDFRIFRDFGHIPGLDFAHIFNGYRYHTKYDSVKFLSPRVLQRTGDNILAMARQLSNGNELSDGPKNHPEGRTVFFDFIGLFFVSYSSKEGAVANTVVAIGAFLIGFWCVFSGLESRNYARAVLKETLVGFAATLLGSAIAVALAMALAYTLDSFDRSMAWFSSCSLIIGLYCCPTWAILCISHRLLHHWLQNGKSPLSLTLIIQARINGVNLFWGLLTMAMTVVAIRSAYIFVVLLTLSMFSSLIITLLRMQTRTSLWLTVFIIVHSGALLWTTQFYHIFTNIFIPITGRSGEGNNPDHIIGIVSACCTILITSYLTALINLLRKPSITIFTLLTIFAAAIVLSFTAFGFPYRDASEGSPTVQRISVHHTFRQIHNLRSGTVQTIDSGYLMRLWDRHNRRTIKSITKYRNTSNVFDLPECATEVFCALPASALRFGSLWIQGGAPDLPHMVHLNVTSKETLAKDNVVRLNFTLTGSHQSSLLVQPKANVTLIRWSLLDDKPSMLSANNHSGYFILITHGLSGNPIQLSMDLKVNGTAAEHEQHPLVDVSVTTNFWEYHEHHTDGFNHFIESFPSWAHVVPSVMAVNVYKI